MNIFVIQFNNFYLCSFLYDSNLTESIKLVSKCTTIQFFYVIMINCNLIAIRFFGPHPQSIQHFFFVLAKSTFYSFLIILSKLSFFVNSVFSGLVFNLQSNRCDCKLDCGKLNYHLMVLQKTSINEYVHRYKYLILTLWQLEKISHFINQSSVHLSQDQSIDYNFK